MNDQMSVLIGAISNLKKEEKILRIPVKCGIFFPIGSQICPKLSQDGEKYSGMLNKFLKEGHLSSSNYRPYILDCREITLSKESRILG